MATLIRQTGMVVGIAISSLHGRMWPAISSILSIALAVLTLLAFLAMSTGFSRTVTSTGSENAAIILSAGANAEVASNIPFEAVRLLEQSPGIAKDHRGRPVVSREALVVIDAAKRAGSGHANVSLRGVTPAAANMRPGFVIREGRMPALGSGELIVGAGVLREFAGFEIGQDRQLGGKAWKVVGVFEVRDTVFDSEVWADLSTVQALFDRGGGVQALRVGLKAPAAIKSIEAYADADPRLRVGVMSEKDHYAGQSDKLSLLIYFGWALASMLALGSLAGALNTMYAAVEARAGENITLRAIGFGRWPIFAGVMMESLLLALAGALLGGLVALAVFNGMTASTLGQGFTQVVFKLTVGPSQLMPGVVLGLALGFAGGIFPAIRAATAPVLMRES